MQYAGKVYWWEEGEEQESTVSAIVTKTRISADYVDRGSEEIVLTNSDDGSLYKGNYGSNKLVSQDKICELKRFDGKDEVLMLGTWFSQDSGLEGNWYFRLRPTKSA